jgi:SAM-dependent methyltransferase
VERDFYQRYYELEDRHWWFMGRRTILLSILEQHIGGRRDLRLLDFGCGTGTTAGQLARFGSVEAVDVNPDAVAFCRSRGLANVQQLAGPTLPFDDREFDVVTSFDVLEHIEDDLSALTELRRVVKQGGTLLCAVPAFPFLWGLQDEVSHHFRRYVRPQLRARLEDAGFEVLRASYFNLLLFPAIAGIRVARRLLPGFGHTGNGKPLQSDFELGPAWLNAALARVFGTEATLLRTRDLPCGVSLFALCEPRAEFAGIPSRSKTA